jgi:hypothetical protein
VAACSVNSQKKGGAGGETLLKGITRWAAALVR